MGGYRLARVPAWSSRGTRPVRPVWASAARPEVQTQ